MFRMGYRVRRFSLSFILSFLLVVGLGFLIVSSTVALALMPALGVGGLYAQADRIVGSQGTVYPEYQGQTGGFGSPTDPYSVGIGTTTPECPPPGIPMLVISLEGNARATSFDFRKDVRLPLFQDRWMVININDVTLSGEEIKIFTTQFGGDFIELKNVRLLEGGIKDPNTRSNTQWGPNSNQFVLKGGIDTKPTVPGLEAQEIEAWIHGATGKRITLEKPGGGLVGVDVSYRRTQDLVDFYEASASSGAKLGYGLTDKNIDFDGSINDDRVKRGGPFANDGYFTCSPPDGGGVE